MSIWFKVCLNQIVKGCHVEITMEFFDGHAYSFKKESINKH